MTEDATLGLGTPVLPPLPMHGGDRNRTSPFAFTGNKFEFRALGSSMSLAFPNTVLNTIVAEAIDELADKLDEKISAGEEIGAAVAEVVKDSYTANRQVCFGGDNYSEEWHAEAERRGLKNLRTTPDALPEVIADDTIAAFEKYNVLSRRELEARFEVWVEQYSRSREHRGGDGPLDREDDAAAGGDPLPAAEVDAARVSGISSELKPLIEDLVTRIRELEQANVYPDGIEGLELAEYARDKQLATMHEVRDVADKLEEVVADDLWPLPKYCEILFIK